MRWLALLALLFAARAHAEKSDVVILENGDHLTGEIKGMTHGKLDFKTDDAGRLSIEWTKITFITSDHAFEVEMGSGKKYYGTLESPVAKQVKVGSEDVNTFQLIDIIALTPMDDEFWSRVKAYLDLGFTLAKSSSAMTLSGDGEFAYRGQHLGAAFDFTTYVQSDSSKTAVGQYTLNLTGNYFFPRWRMQLQVGADHNDELDLKLRLSIGAGASYPLIRNNAMELWISAGLVADREQYTTGDPNLNLAGYVGGSWDVFRYDTPKLDGGVDLAILPVLTDWGRVRGNLTLRVKYELFYNFYLGLNFNYTFDTRPPDPTASNTDYLFSFTIGWSFHR